MFGDAGVVVPEADEAAWTDALDGLIEHPDRRADLARRGLERARTEFALPIVARRHLDFFDAVLNRSLTRRRGDAEK